MRKQNIKKTVLRIGCSIVLVSMLSLSLFSCERSQESSLPLSPALNCISAQSAMAKSAPIGELICFSADDFSRALNLKKIDSITITKVPPVSDGQLRIGSTVLTAPQTLSTASISLLTYVPTKEIPASEFSFTVNNSTYEMTCKLYSLATPNYAPTLNSVPALSLSVSTYRNTSLYGTLSCYDPDGDQTYIEIVSYPERGVLILEDAAAGSYKFIPYADVSGKDSFVYVARDKYGNYSPSATVNINIEKQQSSIRYVDLNDSPYHNAAIAMTEAGIMNGSKVGGSFYFYPDTKVSRAEFTVLALNTVGIKDVNTSLSAPFADSDEIPEQMQSYIAAAYDLGYIDGIEKDGKLCFEPNRAITLAEASVMLAQILEARAPTLKPVFSDKSDIPTWAEGSIYTLHALGVISEDTDNNISPEKELTRKDTAQILTGVMRVKKK